MWKVTLAIFLAVFSTTTAQTAFNCTFSVNFYQEYICRLDNVTAPTRGVNYTFGGAHLENRTNANVEVIIIRNSNTPFMIPQLFTTFPNIFELDIQGSNLQSIEIPDNIQLEWLILSNNNISRINNGTFRNQESLRYFTAINSGIFEIDEDAFVGLSNLQNLVLINNNVSEILPRTFEPLISAYRIDFERNNLVRLGNIFNKNDNLTLLYFEYNEINAISPNLLNKITGSLASINLYGNRCVDRYFFFVDEIELILFNNLVSLCFQNFVDRSANETRRITLEFNGPLRLFDEFGNIIANVN